MVGLEPTCCLQHRFLSPTGCPQPSKQSLLANATSVFCEYSTQTTRTLPLPSRRNKKSLGKNRGTLVLVVGLEPTCCLQHRILSPTRLPFHHTSTFYSVGSLVTFDKFSRKFSFHSNAPHQQSAYLIYHKPSQLSIVFTQFDKIFLPPRTFCAKNNAQPLLTNRLCGKITK